MNLGHPAFLGALALLVPIIVAFLVHRRRQVIRVPSTMIWRIGARSVVKNRRMKNLRRLLALLACLIGVATLVVAAARPSTGHRGDTAVFVVDGSASMAGAPLSEARRWLTRELASLGPSAHVAIVTAGDRARVVLPPTRPGPRVEQAVASLAAGPEGSAMEEAIGLAEGLAGGGAARVVVLSDEPVDAELSRLAGRTVGRVFARTARDNVGIVSLFTQALPESSDEAEREVSITIATSSARTRRVRWTLTHDGVSVAERALEVPARGESRQRATIRGGGRLVARVEPIDGLSDALVLDDEAVLEQPARRLLRVAIVGGDPVGAFFVEKALRAAGVASIAFVKAAGEPPKEGEIDLAAVLEDGPGRPVDVPQFLLGAAPSDLGLVAHAIGPTETRLRSIASDDPLVRGVALDDLTVQRAQVAAAPRGARVLVDLDGGPALLAGGVGAHAWVWLGIDPDASDLVLRVPFPVLMGNVLAHLGGVTQSVAAKTLPRSEVMLASADVAKALPTAPEPKWRVSVSPQIVLVAIGVILLLLEGLLTYRSSRRVTRGASLTGAVSPPRSNLARVARNESTVASGDRAA